MVAYSVNGVPIRLSEERWLHIVSHHNEMAAYYFEVLEVITQPERIFEGNAGELIAVKEHSPGKYFVVIYREIHEEDGFVITAFLTKRIKQIERRKLIWQKKQR